MTDAQLAQLAALTTSAVSDALDRLGIAGQCAGIMPLDRSFRLVGRAWTLRYGPVGRDPGTVGDYIDDLGPGQVVALDNHSRLDATVWGDLLTTTASSRGVAGTVIDGVCRDILLGDADGVVAIPAARADEVTAVATEIEAAEDAIREAVAAGASLREARAAVSYHTLPRRDQPVAPGRPSSRSALP